MNKANYQLDNSRTSDVLAGQIPIPNGIDPRRRAPWSPSEVEDLVQAIGLHGSHFGQTSIGQCSSDENDNVAPEQVPRATIDCDEENLSDLPYQPIVQVRDDCRTPHANRISHVHISVLPNPSREINWKFL